MILAAALIKICELDLFVLQQLVSRTEEYGKRDLCHGLKLIVLSMRGGYLATESSRDTSRCVGSLNNSGNTVKECTGHRGLKPQSGNISLGMRFEEFPSKVVDGGWIKVSFDPWHRSLFPYSSAQGTQTKRDLYYKGIQNFSLLRNV